MSWTSGQRALSRPFSPPTTRRPARHCAIFKHPIQGVGWYYFVLMGISIFIESIARKRYPIITIKHKSYSLARFYSIADDGRNRQYITRWPRNATSVQFTADNYKYTSITIRPPGTLHTSIIQYWTPRRHLHIIPDTPNGNVLEHQLIYETYTYD